MVYAIIITARIIRRIFICHLSDFKRFFQYLLGLPNIFFLNRYFGCPLDIFLFTCIYSHLYNAWYYSIICVLFSCEFWLVASMRVFICKQYLFPNILHGIADSLGSHWLEKYVKNKCDWPSYLVYVTLGQNSAETRAVRNCWGDSPTGVNCWYFNRYPAVWYDLSAGSQ